MSDNLKEIEAQLASGSYGMNDVINWKEVRTRLAQDDTIKHVLFEIGINQCRSLKIPKIDKSKLRPASIAQAEFLGIDYPVIEFDSMRKYQQICIQDLLAEEGVQRAVMKASYKKDFENIKVGMADLTILSYVHPLSAAIANEISKVRTANAKLEMMKNFNNIYGKFGK